MKLAFPANTMQLSSLDEKQTKALELLMEGMKVREVAQELGVSMRTMFRWMDSLDYRAQLEQAQRSAINLGRTKLSANTEKAIDVIVAALDNMNGITRDQVSAATSLLDRVGLSAKFQLEYESIDDALKKLPPEELKDILLKRLQATGGIIDATQEEEGEE